MADYTPIKIRRTAGTSAPVIDQLFPEGSLAYAYDKANDGDSGKLFFSALDNNDSGIVHVIGGKYYTQIIDAATTTNTANTLVLRDADGNFEGNVIGSASYLDPGFYLEADGDATGTVFIDGTGNALLTLDLEDTGVTPGTYGGSTQIPFFEVDSKGRLVEAGNVNISTDIEFAGDTGNVTVSTGDTMNIVGNTQTGISTDASSNPDTITISYSGVNNVEGTPNQIEVDVDDQTATISLPDELIVPGNMEVTGNLAVKGQVTTVKSVTVETNDSLLKLANSNITSDVIDIGFYGEYYNGSDVVYTGLIRKASDKKFHLLSDVPTDPTGNVISGGSLATLVGNLEGGTVSNLAAPIAVEDGGTGADILTAGQILVGDGTNPVQSLGGTDGYILQMQNGEAVFGIIDGGVY